MIIWAFPLQTDLYKPSPSHRVGAPLTLPAGPWWWGSRRRRARCAPGCVCAGGSCRCPSWSGPSWGALEDGSPAPGSLLPGPGRRAQRWTPPWETPWAAWGTSLCPQSFATFSGSWPRWPKKRKDGSDLKINEPRVLFCMKTDQIKTYFRWCFQICIFFTTNIAQHSTKPLQ